jgi:chitosanase
MQQLKKLNSRGIAHVAIIAIVIVGVAAFGTYRLVASNAATCKTYTWRTGQTNNCVKNIQRITNAAGARHWHYSGGAVIAVDGQFGPKTKAQVIYFQRAVRISQDGIVGPQTWAQLCKYAGMLGAANDGYKAAVSSGCIYPKIAPKPTPLPTPAPAPAPAPAPSTGVNLASPAKKEIAMELVSSAENSSLNWKAQYGYIEDIKDGRGYTAGIIGFCTGCGDLQQLVAYYNQTTPGNVLAKYIPALAKIGSMNATHAGLDPNFTTDWKTAAATAAFQNAQNYERDRVYFNPAVNQGIADGLHSLGQFIYYDAMVMHGPGSDAVSFGGIRANAMKKAKTPAQGGNETTYLNAYLDVRKAAMLTEVAHDDTSRVDTEQRVFLKAGNLNLNTPLTWSTYGDSYTIK